MGNKRAIMLGNMVLLMREYQKKHKIKKQCVTNCQYFYDNFKANCPLNTIKVKAVIGVSLNSDRTIIYEGHVVVEVDEKFILEPSYEVYSTDNIEYFDNIKQFMNKYKIPNKHMKHLIKDFIDFTKIADTINNGGLHITDNEYYNNQADYVEEKIKPFL